LYVVVDVAWWIASRIVAIKVLLENVVILFAARPQLLPTLIRTILITAAVDSAQNHVKAAAHAAGLNVVSNGAYGVAVAETSLLIVLLLAVENTKEILLMPKRL